MRCIPILSGSEKWKQHGPDLTLMFLRALWSPSLLIALISSLFVRLLLSLSATEEHLKHCLRPVWRPRQLSLMSAQPSAGSWRTWGETEDTVSATACLRTVSVNKLMCTRLSNKSQPKKWFGKVWTVLSLSLMFKYLQTADIVDHLKKISPRATNQLQYENICLINWLTLNNVPKCPPWRQ